jgi:hypothetical protein
MSEVPLYIRAAYRLRAGEDGRAKAEEIKVPPRNRIFC